jgi:serine phosphatase RsbU (regulator of sigma subunit)
VPGSDVPEPGPTSDSRPGPIVSSVSSGWTSSQLRLTSGELVLIHTDGVVEARDTGRP